MNLITVIGILLTVLIIGLCLWTRCYEADFIAYENPGFVKKAVLPASLLLVDLKTRLLNKSKGVKNESLDSALKAFYPQTPADTRRRRYEMNSMFVVIVCLLAGSLLCTVYSITNHIETQLSEIMRPLSSDEKIVSLYVEGLGETEGYLEIPVSPIRLTDEQITAGMDDAADHLIRSMLGENLSVDEVRMPLSFTGSQAYGEFKAKWMPMDLNIIGLDGGIVSENIPEEGIVTGVTLTLTYQEAEQIYPVYLLVLPRLKSDSEVLWEGLMEQIETAEQKTRLNTSFSLPTEYAGHSISFKILSNTAAGAYLILLSFLFGLGFWFHKNDKLKQYESDRKQQLLLDYPRLITSLSILLGAGLSVRAALERIDLGAVRFSTQEIRKLLSDIEGGRTETTAYQEFGKRIGLLPYLRLGSILEQHIKKGNRGLEKVLRQEVLEATEDQKQTIKRLGEAAGTKLLVPMCIQFITILIIIMVPAFISFQF